MSICGYHLRCLNQGNSCSDCGHQNKDRKEDYLNDVLNVWPKGREAVCVAQKGVTQTVLTS